MTNPLTPPPELVQQWHVEAMKGFRTNGVYEQDIATQAAQWGADQELEACCEWLTEGWDEIRADKLRAARRPKPPSLKEQALAELEEIMTELHNETGSAFTASAIRRALEALPDD